MSAAEPHAHSSDRPASVRRRIRSSMAVRGVPLTGERTLIMGILNVTPDSFSDGGRFDTLDAALEHAAELTAQGADLIDIGGESTRPGAERVPVAEEQRRVLPLVRELARGGIAVSVDTMNAATALAAAHAGAAVINDVSGGLADPDMTRVAIETGLPFVVMHWRGHSAEMAAKASYTDVVSDVRRELEYRVAELIVRGVDPAKIIVDPGIGFSKNAEHNWALLGHYGELAALGLPVLVAASRKGFLAPLVAEGAAPDARDAPSAVLAAIAASQGAWAVRVHNVAETRAALDVADAWRRGARS
ncbi:dihydropteroate synthase [Agreia sp. VKM Ac-1783]|uniref:dihydropteroate synthase n=1 Tax=Agreia sp. VKM Ac-1783 TaxID=1938889 RepID=UPI0032C3DD51